MSSPDGRNFLAQLLNPYEDRAQNLVGYPDADSSKTVVIQTNQQVTISRPGGLVAGANWDLHIVTSDELVYRPNNKVLHNPTTATYDDRLGRFHSTLISDYPAIGPVMWNKVATTLNTFDNVVGVSEYDASNITEYLQGPVRVVGFGVEARDVTAEINKQGSVTCYRMPQNCYEEVSQATTDKLIGFDPSPMYAFGNSMVCCSKLFPQNVSQAMKLRDTVAWESAKGAYVVALPNSQSNPMKTSRHMMRAWIADGPTETTPPSHPVAAILSAHDDFEEADYLGNWQTISIPYNSSGIYFTGLAYESTISLTIRMVLELTPVNVPLLEALARPSPSLDTQALELASTAISRVPVAVPFADNASGDWTRYVNKILGAGRFIARSVAEYVPDPKVKAFAVAADVAMRSGQKLIPMLSKKKKKRKKTAPLKIAVAKRGGPFTGSTSNKMVMDKHLSKFG